MSYCVLKGRARSIAPLGVLLGFYSITCFSVLFDPSIFNGLRILSLAFYVEACEIGGNAPISGFCEAVCYNQSYPVPKQKKGH